MDWTLIIATVFSFLLTTVGGVWVGYVIKGAKVAKEAGDLMTVAGQALEDKNVTPEEIAQILKEYNDLKEAIAAFKNLKKK